MGLLDQRLAGVVILLVLAALVVVKRRATGSMIDLPSGGVLLKTVNIFNLLFLLVVSPLAAVLLIARTAASIDPTYVSVGPFLASAIRVAGLLMYVGGYTLMGWALIVLGRQYQPGGAVPHPGDRIVVEGPYRFVRHPMYAAALVGAFGLSLLMQSWAFFCAFLIYLALIIALVGREEDGLRRAFGGEYAEYQTRVRRLLPFVY